MGEQTVWGAGTPSRSPGFQQAAWGMIFFFCGLGCLAAINLLPYTREPYAFYGSMGCFAIGLILSGHAWRQGAQPRSLCKTGTVLCALALIVELGFVAFAFLMSHMVLAS
jgi:hypothetical protein